MKNKIVLALIFISFVPYCYAMQEWFQTSLSKLGLTQPQLTPTQELKQIIDREGSFKGVGYQKVRTLIDAGADVNVVGVHAMTPLLVAINDNDRDLVRLFLLQKNNEVNKKYGNDGLTPLAIASYDGKYELIPLLLRYGADIRTRDAQDNTPLILATRLADDRVAANVAQQLIDAGVDINAQNKSGETALFRATARKRYALIELLINNGANPKIATKDGNNAEKLAQESHDQKIINLVVRKPQKIK